MQLALNYSSQIEARENKLFDYLYSRLEKGEIVFNFDRGYTYSVDFPSTNPEFYNQTGRDQKPRHEIYSNSLERFYSLQDRWPDIKLEGHSRLLAAYLSADLVREKLIDFFQYFYSESDSRFLLMVGINGSSRQTKYLLDFEKLESGDFVRRIGVPNDSSEVFEEENLSLSFYHQNGEKEVLKPLSTINLAKNFIDKCIEEESRFVERERQLIRSRLEYIYLQESKESKDANSLQNFSTSNAWSRKKIFESLQEGGQVDVIVSQP